MTLVINPVIGCCCFPPGPRLLSQPKRSPPPWPVPNYTAWLQRHTGVSSLPKDTTRWCSGLELATCESQVRYLTNSDTALHSICPYLILRSTFTSRHSLFFHCLPVSTINRFLFEIINRPFQRPLCCVAVQIDMRNTCLWCIWCDINSRLWSIGCGNNTCLRCTECWVCRQSTRKEYCLVCIRM